jgi:choline dehydrogenase
MKTSDLAETRLVKAFLAAGRELGYDVVDVNGRNQLGFSNGQGYLHEGVRYSTTIAYREPALARPNLDFATNAIVRKVLIDNARATGVEIVLPGQSAVKVKANREVILSAGAIESPRILMLSGVGPAEHLDKMGIRVECNVPVGDNLQDHPMCVLEYMLRRPTRSLELEQSRPQTALDQRQNALYTKEVMGRTQGAISFLRTRYAPPDRLYPDIQLQLGNSLIGGIFKNFWNMRSEVWQSLYKHEEGVKYGMYITTMLLHPKSVGTIRLKGPDPDLEPLIDPKFLHHPDDARTLKEGLKLQFQLQNTECFSEIGAELSPLGLPELPGRPHQGSALYSDDYLERFVRSQTLTGHHPAGTCKMGAPSDPKAVVDSELRVYGVSGLRVVDASIMPRVPSGNTSAPTIMVAERAADLIRGVNTVGDIVLPEEVLQEAEARRHARAATN